MTLKHICTEFCIIVIISSVFHTTRTEKEQISQEIVQHEKNMSNIKSLLQNVIKNYQELKKIDKSDSEETDDETESEKKKVDNMYARNKGRQAFKITTGSQVFKGTPLFFSDESWREGESEVEGKKIKDVTKNSGNIRNSATSFKDFKTTKVKIDLTTDNNMKVKNVKDETESESSADKSSTDEEVKGHSQAEENFKEEPHDKKKVLIIHVAHDNSSQINSRASTVKQEHISSNNPKILKSAQKVLHNPQSEEDREEEVLHNSHSGEEKAMHSEVLKANYLRQAYADACKQVVIRKCLRALRAVSKDVCSKGRKCSSKYKDDFRQNGQAGCDRQFNNQTSACRMGVETDEAAAISQRRALDNKEAETPERANDETPKVNILRDRYENACKKASYKKCLAACKYASDKTCKQHECIGAKKKALKTSCKRRCQETFSYSGGGSDDSDEDKDEDSSD